MPGVREAAACGRGGGRAGERDLCTMWAEVRKGGAGVTMETRFPQNKRQLPSSRALYYGRQLSQWRQREVDAMYEHLLADFPAALNTKPDDDSAAEAAVGYSLA